MLTWHTGWNVPFGKELIEGVWRSKTQGKLPVYHIQLDSVGKMEEAYFRDEI